MTDAGLADYRVVFATPGTPPRKVRGVRLTGNPDLPDTYLFEDASCDLVWAVPRESVLFIERLDRQDADDITDRAGPAVILETGDAEPRRGLARVAAAVRPAH